MASLPQQQQPASFGTTPSKKQTIIDTLLNFGRPTYAPLTPIEILPGIMSNDGVATVFQLDTRKPRTQKQAAKMAAKKRSASAAAAPQPWQDALMPSSDQSGSCSGTGSTSRSINNSSRTGVEGIMGALTAPGKGDCASQRTMGSKVHKKKERGKMWVSNNASNYDPPYPNSKPELSPTDLLTVKHANPFTGMLSRNQSQLNISQGPGGCTSGRRSMSQASMNNRPLPDPPYPHSCPRYSAISSPSLLNVSEATLEDLIPMPSVHEPAPFSFPGATADEIDAYERAVETATTSVANHLAIPTFRKPATLSENERSTTSSKAGHFLALDGGLEQQPEWARHYKKKDCSTRASSLQDRHLQIPELQEVNNIRPPPMCYQASTPNQENLLSVLNMGHRPHKSKREQHTYTSICTMNRKGETHMPRLESGENKATAETNPPRRRMEKVRVSAIRPKKSTGATANTGTTEKGERVRPHRRTGSGPGLALFDTSIPFIHPRQLAEYRRARAGLPPLKEEEGVMKRVEKKGLEYRSPFPFKLDFDSPSSETVTESESEWENQKVPRSKQASGSPRSEPHRGRIGNYGATFEPLLMSFIPLGIGFSIGSAIQEIFHKGMKLLEPVLTLNAPPQFWELPIVLRVLFGLWYFVIVTLGILIVIRVIRIVNEVVGLVMIPVRGVIWAGRVICGV